MVLTIWSLRNVSWGLVALAPSYPQTSIDKNAIIFFISTFYNEVFVFCPVPLLNAKWWSAEAKKLKMKFSHIIICIYYPYIVVIQGSIFDKLATWTKKNVVKKFKLRIFSLKLQSKWLPIYWLWRLLVHVRVVTKVDHILFVKVLAYYIYNYN